MCAGRDVDIDLTFPTRCVIVYFWTNWGDSARLGRFRAFGFRIGAAVHTIVGFDAKSISNFDIGFCFSPFVSAVTILNPKLWAIQFVQM